MKINSLLILSLLLFTAGCNSDNETPTEQCIIDLIPGTDKSVLAITNDVNDLSKIELPEGFKIELYANVTNARQMAVSPSGIVFVGAMTQSEVYAFQDTDCDNKADKKWKVATGLNGPNGVAFKDGDLYVAEVHRIIKYKNIIENLNNIPSPEVIKALPVLPGITHHSHRYINFGPDGKLYVTIGTPCPNNVITEECSQEPYGTIMRMNADGTGMETFARGIRNSVGLDWHPTTGDLWFTDPGAEFLDNSAPSCELNRATAANQHFGFPNCHQGDMPDPLIGDENSCSGRVAPMEKLGAHITPLGLKFYTGTMFPEKYRNQLFVALKGSYYRYPTINGHEIIMVKITNGESAGVEIFAKGWLENPNAENAGLGSWGRPVDVLTLKDGSILISDDNETKGGIYRISYK